MLENMVWVSTFEGAAPRLNRRIAGNNRTPRTVGAAGHAGWDDRQDDRGGRAMTMWDRMAERERQMDQYRQAVERHLGTTLAQVQDGDFERFFGNPFTSDVPEMVASETGS
jgi:hypothetical protein